jgi:hypothetical protein
MGKMFHLDFQTGGVDDMNFVGDVDAQRRSRAQVAARRLSQLPASSKTPAKLENGSRRAKACVIDIGRELHALVRYADQEATLNTKTRLQCPRTLRRQSYALIPGLDGKLLGFVGLAKGESRVQPLGPPAAGGAPRQQGVKKPSS